MRYVVDCSVALKWFIPEPLSELAIPVLERFRAASLVLIAPEIILAEFGHALRKRVGFRQLAREEAVKIWEDFLTLGIDLAPDRDLARLAFPLALDHMATFYDALYVALAQREDVPVLTADERMTNAFASLDRTVSLASLE